MGLDMGQDTIIMVVRDMVQVIITITEVIMEVVTVQVVMVIDCIKTLYQRSSININLIFFTL